MADVRMRGFTKRTTVDAAFDWLDRTSTLLPAETIPIEELSGRVLARRSNTYLG